MAITAPAPLCTHLLPTGKLCRGVALRNQSHCRAHIRDHRLDTRERARLQATDRLAEKVGRLDFPQLLSALSRKLEDLNCAYTLARFPEIRFLLGEVMFRLEEEQKERLNQAQLEAWEAINSATSLGLTPEALETIASIVVPQNAPQTQQNQTAKP